jgi:hypothetical protein
MPSIDVYVAGGGFADRQRLAGVLDRETQPGLIGETCIVASAGHDAGLADRSWVALTEFAEGGWRVAARADTASDLARRARLELAAQAPTGERAAGRCS